MAAVCEDIISKAEEINHAEIKITSLQYSAAGCPKLATEGSTLVLAPLYISGLLMRMWASFTFWHPSLSLKICFHMPEPCSTGV